jgi:hypothetical protein
MSCVHRVAYSRPGDDATNVPSANAGRPTRHLPRQRVHRRLVTGLYNKEPDKGEDEGKRADRNPMHHRQIPGSSRGDIRPYARAGSTYDEGTIENVGPSVPTA